MGEELEFSSFILRGPDGKEYEWNGLTTATIISDEDNKQYADIRNTETMEFSCEAHTSRKTVLLFLVGYGKRTIRRALRWDEKLRRMEIKNKVKFGDRLYLAAECARFKGNNRKRKIPHFYTYWFRMEREDDE